jgi:hypothetical protein
VIAAIVMLVGIAFLAAITVSVTVTSVECAQRRGLDAASSVGERSHGDA